MKIVFKCFRPVTLEPQRGRDRTCDAASQLLHRHGQEEEQGGANKVSVKLFEILGRKEAEDLEVLEHVLRCKENFMIRI